MNLAVPVQIYLLILETKFGEQSFAVDVSKPRYGLRFISKTFDKTNLYSYIQIRIRYM